LPWRHIKEVTWFENAKDKSFNIMVGFDGNSECREWLLRWIPVLTSVCENLLKQKTEGEAKDERKEG